MLEQAIKIKELEEKKFFEFQILEKQYLENNQRKLLLKSLKNHEGIKGINDFLTIRDKFIEIFSDDSNYSTLVEMLKKQKTNDLPIDITDNYKESRKNDMLILCLYENKKMTGFIIGFIKEKKYVDIFYCGDLKNGNKLLKEAFKKEVEKR